MPEHSTNPSGERLYSGRFFEVFAATVVFMTGAALLFHFGQFVQDYLSFDVTTLGRILSISMLGTLLIRLHIGRWIDRLGCRPVWLVGALVVAVTRGGVQFATGFWTIVCLRTLSMMAAAAVMTTVAVFAAQIAPPHRRAESIGIMGLAGFLGMMVGPTMGDWILADAGGSITPYRVFFTASALCSLISGVVILLVKLPASRPVGESARPGAHGDTAQGAPARGEAPPSVEPATLRVIARHWPGAVMLVGVVFTMAFCVQIIYLERLAEVRGFENIKMFFLVYGPTSMVLRITLRRLPQRIGRTRTLLLGLGLLSVGLLALTRAYTAFGLVVPAFLMGAGHCFIFPSMVDLGAERLPPRYRGTGTSLILGAGDLGLLIGFWAIGAVIDRYGFDAMLVALAATVLATAVFLAVARRRDVFGRLPSTTPLKK